jgi:hypothetical protein
MPGNMCVCGVYYARFRKVGKYAPPKHRGGSEGKEVGGSSGAGGSSSGDAGGKQTEQASESQNNPWMVPAVPPLPPAPPWAHTSEAVLDGEMRGGGGCSSSSSSSEDDDDEDSDGGGELFIPDGEGGGMAGASRSNRPTRRPDDRAYAPPPSGSGSGYGTAAATVEPPSAPMPMPLHAIPDGWVGGWVGRHVLFWVF